MNIQVVLTIEGKLFERKKTNNVFKWSIEILISSYHRRNSGKAKNFSTKYFI